MLAMPAPRFYFCKCLALLYLEVLVCGRIFQMSQTSIIKPTTTNLPFSLWPLPKFGVIASSGAILQIRALQVPTTPLLARTFPSSILFFTV